MVLLSYTGGGSTTFEDFSQIAYKPSLPHGLGWKLSNLTRAARGWYAMSDDEQLVRFEIGLTHHTVETDGVRKTESAGDSCTNDVKRYSSLYGNATIPRGALGLITQTFGKYSLALAKRRNRGNATKWKYEIEDIDVDQSACMNLLFAYLSGTTALAASTVSFVLAILMVVMTTRVETGLIQIDSRLPIFLSQEWQLPTLTKLVNGDFGMTSGDDLVPQTAGFVQWVETVSCGHIVFDVVNVKKRVLMALGYAAAYLSGVAGILCITTSALVSEFHGHWYHYNWPWYTMGISGFIAIFIMNELITLMLMYVPPKMAIALDNVPEGLWARKVEAGGVEGFTEKLLGIEFEQAGDHEIRVMKSSGFASSRGRLTDGQARFWNSGASTSLERARPKDVQYYGNNVQVGDIFLGIMTKKTSHTLLLPKTNNENIRDLSIIQGYDLPGGYMENPRDGQLIRFATLERVWTTASDEDAKTVESDPPDWQLVMRSREPDAEVLEEIINPYPLTARELVSLKPEANLQLVPSEHDFDQRAIEDALVVHLMARLNNALKEVEVPNVKEYRWLSRANAAIEEALDMICRAITEANPPAEEETEPVPFWLVLWRVNGEGLRDRLFPIESQIPGRLKKEVETMWYDSHSRLVQYEPLSQFVSDLGLEIMDLDNVADNGYEVTEGLRVLSSSDYGQNLMIKPDDIIVGINYVPLTKNISARSFNDLLPKLPMPFVINMAKKKGGPSTAREWEMDLEPNRFVKVLLSLMVVMATFCLNSMALGSAEWTRLHHLVGVNETFAMPAMQVRSV